MLGMTALRNKFSKSSVLNAGPINKKYILAFLSTSPKKEKAPSKEEAEGKSPMNHDITGGIETWRGFSSSLSCAREGSNGS
jgi:hypothetical protein